MSEDLAASMVERSDGLIVPRSVMARQELDPTRLDFPISFHSGSSSLVPLGSQPNERELLRSIQGWAAIAARVLADRVMGLEPLVIARRRVSAGSLDEEILDDHPLKMLLDDPGPIFSRELLLRLTAYHLLQTGEAFWQKVRDSFGLVVQLWPIPPQNVTLIPSDGPDVIAGYRVRSGVGREVDLPRADVIRIWHPDPETLYGSLGVLGPQALEFDAQRYLAEHVKRHFESDATPRVAIVGQAGAHAPEGEELLGFLSAWANAYQSRKGTQVGTPAFIPPGFDAKVLDAHSDKAHLAPLSESLASQILSAYGVSPISVGRDTNVNRATAETSGWLQDQNAVLPLTRVIASSLTRQLAVADFAPDTPSTRLVVRFEDFIAPDKAFELARDKQRLDTKVESINQQRARHGLDPVDWGELPVGSLADAPYDGSGFGLGGSEDAADLTGADRGGPSGPARAELLPRDLDHERRELADLLWARVLQSERKFVGRMTRAMAGIFDVQRKAIVAALKKAGRADGLELARTEIDDVLSDARLTTRLFAARFEPLRKQAVRDAGQQMQLDLGTDRAHPGRHLAELARSQEDLGGEFVFTADVTSRITTQGSQMVTNVNAATRRALNRELAAGVADGDSLASLTSRVNSVMRNRKRARTIARTELVRANQAGQLESMKQAGIEEHQWNTARDGDERHPSRENLEGQRVTIGDLFDLGDGVLAEHPGDPNLPPEESINCRCFLSPVIGEA